MALEDFLKAIHDKKGKEIIDYLSNCGVNRDDYEIEFEEVYIHNAEPSGEVKQVADANTSFYYYTGPLDDKTRPFCRALLNMNKFWSQTNLDYLGVQLGYDVFVYEGGFNCRHKWMRARIKGKLQAGFEPDLPRRGQIDRASDKQQRGLWKYFD
jgi:hypothetical protein